MAIILASIQICSPLFVGLEHSACQLGTVAVFKPFPKPVKICLGPAARKGNRVRTSDNAANDKLVSGQVLRGTIRYLGETRRSGCNTYSWYGSDLYYRPNRNEGSPYRVSCGCSCDGSRGQPTDVHVLSPPDLVPIEQGEECSEQASNFINCGIERLHG